MSCDLFSEICHLLALDTDREVTLEFLCFRFFICVVNVIVEVLSSDGHQESMR